MNPANLFAYMRLREEGTPREVVEEAILARTQERCLRQYEGAVQEVQSVLTESVEAARRRGEELLAEATAIAITAPAKERIEGYRQEVSALEEEVHKMSALLQEMKQREEGVTDSKHKASERLAGLRTKLAKIPEDPTWGNLSELRSFGRRATQQVAKEER